MKKIPKALVIAFVAVILAAGAVYAYTAITVTSEVEVQEPISIVSVSVEGDGTFDTSSNIWDIGVICPLDTASIAITFDNKAAGAITLSLSAHPASLDGGNLVFSFDNPAVEVPAGGTATVTLSADTTQSLAPGNYSTEVTVGR
jgi:uncharacterized membrane protein